jgi:Ring finger domain
VSVAQLAKLHSGTFSHLCEHCGCREETCTVCQERFEEDDSVLQLPCKHHFHQDCITPWLRDSKLCPVCMAEVVDCSESHEAQGAEKAAVSSA